jgi:hypothetical protein
MRFCPEMVVSNSRAAPGMAMPQPARSSMRDRISAPGRILYRNACRCFLTTRSLPPLTRMVAWNGRSRVSARCRRNEHQDRQPGLGNPGAQFSLSKPPRSHRRSSTSQMQINSFDTIQFRHHSASKRLVAALHVLYRRARSAALNARSASFHVFSLP